MKEGTPELLAVFFWNRSSATWGSGGRMSNGHDMSFSGRNRHLKQKAERRPNPIFLVAHIQSRTFRTLSWEMGKNRLSMKWQKLKLHIFSWMTFSPFAVCKFPEDNTQRFKGFKKKLFCLWIMVVLLERGTKEVFTITFWQSGRFMLWYLYIFQFLYLHMYFWRSNFMFLSFSHCS